MRSGRRILVKNGVKRETDLASELGVPREDIRAIRQSGDLGSSGWKKKRNGIPEVNNKDIKQEYVMRVDCAHGKGIKFIREELLILLPKKNSKIFIMCKSLRDLHLNL